MALRQTTGFVGSLLRLIGPDWTVPDYSTLSRRQKTLVVTIPYRGSHGPLNLLIDSTGIKAEGEGEWHTRKHGGSKRRARQCHSDHVWMAPAGQGLCSGLAFGRSRPCIRRLSCGTVLPRALMKSAGARVQINGTRFSALRSELGVPIARRPFAITSRRAGGTPSA